MWFEDPAEWPWRGYGFWHRKPQGAEEQKTSGTPCGSNLPSGSPYRSGRSKNPQWICTLKPGHSGPHVAHMQADEVIAKWALEMPLALRRARWEVIDDVV